MLEKELEQFDRDIATLDADTVKTNLSLIKLTRWIIILTIVMIFIGLIQLVVMWPKRTYCITIDAKTQTCIPDYWPYDTNPSDAAYKLDQQLNF